MDNNKIWRLAVVILLVAILAMSVWDRHDVTAGAEGPAMQGLKEEIRRLRDKVDSTQSTLDWLATERARQVDTLRTIERLQPIINEKYNKEIAALLWLNAAGHGVLYAKNTSAWDSLVDNGFIFRVRAPTLPLPE